MKSASDRSTILFLVFTTAILTVAVAASAANHRGSFVDDDGSVHQADIEAIAARGITRGCNPPVNDRFCPNEPVRRGQMAAFFFRALRLRETSNDAFTDDGGSIFETEINALADAGIARGCNPPANNRFCPDQPVTRGQMAAFLVRVFRYAHPGSDDRFVDDDNTVFERDIESLAHAGITRGCNPPANDRFCPDQPVTRAQMASFLGRALGLGSSDLPREGRKLIIDTDTTIMHERLVLRPGDSIEFRNGAQLMIGEGASVDWQGTPTFTWAQDGKAQNLERDIEIYGEGSIMFMRGSQKSIIRFVEIDLQPKEEINHYPLHWHFVGDGSRGTLVEGVVIKNSTNRAFVPHASHGITFKDTIAKNIAGEAYWWNPPPSPTSADRVNNSNDIIYDHALADGIKNGVGDDRGFTLGAFELGAGTGNIIRDSVARNIRPTHVENCSGFKWPEHSIDQPGVWKATNLKTFGSRCYGIWVWQNTDQEHVVDGYESTEGISHGAYSSDFLYRNIRVPYVESHAVWWDVEGGSIGEVRAVPNHNPGGGEVEFEDVTVGRMIVDNEGGSPVEFIFRNTKSLTCAKVIWNSWASGTTVEVNGTTCPSPG